MLSCVSKRFYRYLFGITITVGRHVGVFGRLRNQLDSLNKPSNPYSVWSSLSHKKCFFLRKSLTTALNIWYRLTFCHWHRRDLLWKLDVFLCRKCSLVWKCSWWKFIVVGISRKLWTVFGCHYTWLDNGVVDVEKINIMNSERK